MIAQQGQVSDVMSRTCWAGLSGCWVPTSPAEVHREPLHTPLLVLAAIAAPSSLHRLPVAAVVGQEAADMQVVLFIPHGNVRHETKERKFLQLNQLNTYKTQEAL